MNRKRFKNLWDLPGPKGFRCPQGAGHRRGANFHFNSSRASGPLKKKGVFWIILVPPMVPTPPPKWAISAPRPQWVFLAWLQICPLTAPPNTRDPPGIGVCQKGVGPAPKTDRGKLKVTPPGEKERQHICIYIYIYMCLCVYLLFGITLSLRRIHA